MKGLKFVLPILVIMLIGSVAMAATLEVGPGKPYTSIQSAIDDATVTDDVLVDAGTYNENITFGGKNIAVRSAGGADVTIINGGASGSVVTFVNAENSNAVLDGFTVTNGSATRGGGIYCNNSSPTLINNIIKNNSGTDGGGIEFWYSNAKLINSLVTNNNASGYGGGIECKGVSTGLVLANNTIANNSAAWGGGLNFDDNSDPTLANTILYGNTASISGSQVNLRDAADDPYFSYCDVQGGTGGFGGSGAGVEYDTTRYQDNIDANPLFVGGVDYHLQTCSPCIDAGDNSRVPGGVTTDLDWNPRFVDDPGTGDTGNGSPPIVDMGAYESLLVSPSSDYVSYLSPADDASCVDTSVVLSWLPGCNSVSYDVYFGTNPGALPLFATLPLGQESYDLGVLELCTTYYWRIDDSIGAGAVWSFTTSCPSCCVRPPLGMVAWWPLDEAEGPTSEDIVGANDGTWIGSPTPLLGEHVANSLSFNGSTDFVRVGDHAMLNFGTGDFSIDAWVKTSLASGVKVILDKRVEPYRGYVLYLYNGTLGLELADGTHTTYGSTFVVANGEWHHVAATVDRDDPNGLVLYVDGAPVIVHNPTGHQGSLTNSANLLIAADCLSSVQRLNGSIDEVELFNRALTAGEIQGIFEAGTAGKCKCEESPVAYKDDVKWSQPPDKGNDGCINGWDELSNYNTAPIIADDWICMDERPITDIHWWGSFKGWTEQTPPADEMPTAFHIGIWTDVPNPDPQDPGTFSHPDRLIWENIAGCSTWSYAGCDVDPRGLSENNACFRFDKLLSQDEWFYQEINYDPGYLDIYVQDDTAIDYVKLTVSYDGQPAISITEGTMDNFVGLEAASPRPALAAFCIPQMNFDNPTVWNRKFGHTISGLQPNITAATLEIRMKPTDTSGGYDSDNDSIALQLGSTTFKWSRRIGTGVDAGTSVPGLLPDKWDTAYKTNGHTFVLDLAALPLVDGGTTSIIDFVNQEKNVYWLSIAAIYDGDTPEHAWGWKTRPHFFNDDAVRITDVSGSWPPSIDAVWTSGVPIEYPAGTSWDMSFALTTNREFTEKLYWPDVKGYPAADLDGNGVVDLGDFGILTASWLECGTGWPEWGTGFDPNVPDP